MRPSFTIIGNGDIICQVREWPQPSFIPAIKWQALASGGIAGTDFGSLGDIYESQVTFYGTESEMNALQAYLDSFCRYGATIGDIRTTIFVPILNQSNLIDVVIEPQPATQVHFASDGTTGQWEIKAKLRADQPTILSGAPSLANLKIQEGVTAGNSFLVNPRYSYWRYTSFYDPAAESGTFVGTFSVNQSDLEDVLAWLLLKRASSFDFPTFTGFPYPFGVARGALPKLCVISGVKIERANLNRWNLQLQFSEYV